MTIVEFLRARYDLEAAHAEKDIWAAGQATKGKWRASYGVGLPASNVESPSSPVARLDGPNHQADALLIARFNPDTVRARAERVLREVEAKRRILDLHPHGRFASLPEEWPEHWRAEIKQALPGTAEPYVGCERDAFNHDYEVIEPAWWCETVLLLALPHSDHPDYDPTWSPT